MLRSRLLTAAVLIPLVMAGVLWASAGVFALGTGLVMLLATREMAVLSGYRSPAQQGSAMVVAVILMLVVYRMAPLALLLPLWQALSLFWVLITIYLIVRRSPVEPVQGTRPLLFLIGIAVLLSAWAAMLGLRAFGAHGSELLMFVLALIWVADSGAYFAGRAFGRNKLSPQVSPGKTWEGVAGALLGALGVALVLDYSGFSTGSLWQLATLCLLVTLVSIGGDLTESLLKRQAQMKDSGSLLPGHGGALDRIDSLVAAVPMFLVGVLFLESVK